MAVSFVDRVEVHFKAGNGGNGCASIRREKFRPLAGPNGGSGGNGGSIFLQASSDHTSLLDFHFSKVRKAQNGEMGYGGSKDGKRGDDQTILVPLGTVVKTKSGEKITELVTNNERFLVVKGGEGGLGNEMIASRQRKAPGFAFLGIPGEEADLVLELKMLADVALVGFPSAGKSSLIAAISAARPKIADYPFTTLVPNLGVVEAFGYRYTVADVPGLIPGASDGKGLGHEFLRHIERTKLIVHVIDCATYESSRDPISDLEAIENELTIYDQKIREDGEPIIERPKIVVLNKVDDNAAKDLALLAKEEIEKRGFKVILTSAITHEGVGQLKNELAKMLQALDSDVELNIKEDDNERPVLKLKELSRKKNSAPKEFEIYKKESADGVYWEVIGEKPRKWVLQTPMSNDEAVGYLADRLAKIGIENELEKMGATEDDEVRISLKSPRVNYLTQKDEYYAFEYNPELSAGAEILYSAKRGEDLRLEYTDRKYRQTRQEKREEYHKRQDERAALREQFGEERASGFWDNPNEEEFFLDDEALVGDNSEGNLNSQTDSHDEEL